MAFTKKLARPNPLGAPPKLEDTPDILADKQKPAEAAPAKPAAASSPASSAPASSAPAAAPASAPAASAAGAQQRATPAERPARSSRARRGRPQEKGAKAGRYHPFPLRVPNDPDNDLWDRIQKAHDAYELRANSLNEFFVIAAAEKLERDKKK